METKLNSRWFVRPFETTPISITVRYPDGTSMVTLAEEILDFNVENGRVTIEYKALNGRICVIFTGNDVYVEPTNEHC